MYRRQNNVVCLLGCCDGFTYIIYHEFKFTVSVSRKLNLHQFSLTFAYIFQFFTSLRRLNFHQFSLSFIYIYILIFYKGNIGLKITTKPAKTIIRTKQNFSSVDVCSSGSYNRLKIFMIFLFIIESCIYRSRRIFWWLFYRRWNVVLYFFIFFGGWFF